MGITIAELTAKLSTDGASTAINEVNQLGVAGDNTSRKLVKGNDATTASFGRMVRNAVIVSGSLIAIKKSADLLISSINVAKDFESAISNLSAITGATGKDLEFLIQKSREFGATTTLSATESAQAFKLIASAKPDLLENGEALAAVTKEAIILAEAAGSTLPEAASTLGASLNQFGADADQAGRFINVLAAGAKFGASEIADTANALRDSGTVAASAGISFEELNAGIQSLSTVAIKGSRAGVALRNVILKLQKDGQSLSQETGGLSGAMQRLLKSGIETTEVMKLFGLENTTAAQALIDNANKLENLTEKLTGTNIAYEQASINVDNLKGDIKKLDSTWEEFQLTLIGSTDSLRDVTQTATSGVKLLTNSLDDLETIGKGIAALLVGQLSKGLSVYTTNVVASIAAQRASTLTIIENAKASSASLGVKAAYAAAEVREAQAAVAASSGIQRLTIAENTLIPAQIRAAAAANAHSASLVKLSAASKSASLVSGGLRNIMGLLGGPVGIITTAATALSFWALTADDAKASTSDLADSVGDLAKNLTQFGIAENIKNTRDQIKLYQESIEQIKTIAPGDAGIARVQALENLILKSKQRLTGLGTQLEELKAKEKEISDIAAGEKVKVDKPETKEELKDFDTQAESVDNLRKSLLTEEQLIGESFLDRTLIIESAFEDNIIKAKERSELLVGIEKDMSEKIADIDKNRIDREKALKEREDERIITRLDLIDDSLKSEESRLEQSLTNRQFMIEDAFQNQLVSDEKRTELLQALESKHQDDLTRIAVEKARTRLSITQGILGNLATLVNSESKKEFEIGKKASLASAVIKGIEAIQSSYAAGARIGGPIVGGIFAATAAIATKINIDRIRAMTFGGSSTLSAPAPSPSTGTSNNIIPIAQPRPTDERDKGKLTVIFQGDMIGWDQHIRERVIGDIKDLVDNQDVIIMSNNSRNAQELSRVGT